MGEHSRYDVQADVAYILENIGSLWEEQERRLSEQYGGHQALIEAGKRFPERGEPIQDQQLVPKALIQAYRYCHSVDDEVKRLGGTPEEAYERILARREMLLLHIIDIAKGAVIQLGEENDPPKFIVYDHIEHVGQLVEMNLINNIFYFYLYEDVLGKEQITPLLKDLGRIGAYWERNQCENQQIESCTPPNERLR